jgi:predicted nucleotidyltransferase
MQDANQVLEEVVSRLRHLPISRIIVFGSTAAASAAADSDLDIAVIVREPARFEDYDQRLELKSEIRRLLRDINRYRPMDLLLYSEAEFQELLDRNGFISNEVAAKGQTIYEVAS